MAEASTDPRSELESGVRARVDRLLAHANAIGPTPSSASDLHPLTRELAHLAGDNSAWAPLARITDPDAYTIHRLSSEDDGPQLLFVHRPVGVMSYTHSHGVWVMLAAVLGIETHRQYARLATGGVGLVEEVDLKPSEVKVLLSPSDIHSHGHVAGRGPAPHILVLTGTNHYQLQRREYDLDTGESRVLAPGDKGTQNLPVPR